MAEYLKIDIGYPGLPPVMDASYTLSQGIQPGTVSVTVQADDLSNLAQEGPIFIGDGMRQISLSGCRVDKVIPTGSVSQATYNVILLDRRWRWRYKPIDGHYNIPQPRIFDVPRVNLPGTQTGNPPTPAQDDDRPPQIQEWTRKSARDLGKLCMEKLGERNYDIRALPKDQYPEVNWAAQRADEALEELATKFGCRVIYNPQLDLAGVATFGEGADLPDLGPGDVSEFSDGIDPPEPPAFVTVYGAPTRFQGRFKCRAVGQDFDGIVKILDDLTYTPTVTWPKIPGPVKFASNAELPNLPGGYTYVDANDLANKTVYRWYQIYTSLPVVSEGVLRIPFDSKSTNDTKRLTDVTLLPVTVETFNDQFGQRDMSPARAYGKATTGDIRFLQTADGDEIKIPFSIQADRQLVEFSGYCRFKDLTADPVLTTPTDLILETACTVLDRYTHAPVRYMKRFPVPGGRGDLEQPLLREDIKLYRRINYVSTTDHRIDTIESNESTCDAQAKYYADAEIAKYTIQRPQTRSYNGIYAIMVDGAIQQVSWSIGPGGVKTTASRGTEHDKDVPPYNQRVIKQANSTENTTRGKQADNDLSRRGNDNFNPGGV